jgi:hypothetical protein
VVGEEGEQRVERRLGAPRRHPPHQIHRRLHVSPLALFLDLPLSLSASSSWFLVLVVIQFLVFFFLFSLFVCLLLFFLFIPGSACSVRFSMCA